MHATWVDHLLDIAIETWYLGYRGDGWKTEGKQYLKSAQLATGLNIKHADQHIRYLHAPAVDHTVQRDVLLMG